MALVECGTRAVLAAGFGPESDGELTYSGRLLSVLDRTMLLLADAGFDANKFAADIQATGAQFLVRSSTRRVPTPSGHLPDGSYLARIGHGVLPALLTIRVIEADVTVTLADGTVRREQWRLLTSLLDAARYPATELITLYHERWQAETTYFSIKATMLDGRVLRSRSLEGIDQEVYALLTTYQALIRAAADTACTRTGLDMDRISFTVLLSSAADTVVSATGILPPAGPAELTGAIGRAVLHPTPRRRRIKARTRKTPPANTDQTPDNNPRSASTTPSTPPSPSSNTDSRTAHRGKRNGVDVRCPDRTQASRTTSASLGPSSGWFPALFRAARTDRWSISLAASNSLTRSAS
ncbi:transposase [Streptomyces sp. NBC_01167]|uniref:transposase n=1 Tax=Streptomyces sp. NBC_01167 TaxID=2903756 RepID=UPI0038668A2A|nr:transposase [Streptomyces sp. NBC_01167]